MPECDPPLPRLIYLTSLALQGHADVLLKPYDLTLEQFHPLKITLLEGGAVGQRDLCGLAGKTPANMTRILDRLAAKGFLERQPDPKDRRAFIIRLTASGEKLVNEAADLFASYLDKIMRDISAQDEKICREVLERIDKNLKMISV
jgi:DNA-binding MarR family transcriptional regulator